MNNYSIDIKKLLGVIDNNVKINGSIINTVDNKYQPYLNL